MRKMSMICVFVSIFLFLMVGALTSFAAQDAKPEMAKPQASGTQSGEMKAGMGYSGMYTFLKEGEFVQLTVEDDGQITGFISRYGEGGSDKGGFLDQFFKSAKLDGSRLSFITQTVQGVWFEFKGKVERGVGKNPGDEAYYVLKGTLVENASDANKKVTSHSKDVMLKMFPQVATSE